MQKYPFRKSDYDEALPKSLGNIESLAMLLNCNVTAVKDYIEESESRKTALKNERQKFIYNAECALFEKIEKGESTSIIYVLKTLGKNSGWTEKDSSPTSSGEVFVPDKTVVETSDTEMKLLMEQALSSPDIDEFKTTEENE